MASTAPPPSQQPVPFLVYAPAGATAPLPFLGDDIFVLIAAELDARMLGRLGCAAQRFWRVSVPDPAHTTDDPAPPELGARASGSLDPALAQPGPTARRGSARDPRTCRNGAGLAPCH